MNESDTFGVDVAGVHRELSLFTIKHGVRIAILNILGDTELVQAASRELAVKLKRHHVDILRPLRVVLEERLVTAAVVMQVE